MKPAGMFGVAPRQQPAMFGGEPIMYDAPQQKRRMPFSPTGFLLDGAATMFGKPLMGAYNGWRQAMGYDQDPNAAPGYVTTDSIRKTGMDMAEGAVMGSAFTRAPAAALRSGVARPDTPPAAALDMSQDARLARAREQGFDTDQTFYHGTDAQPFDSFRPSVRGKMGPGVYFTPNHGKANKFASTSEGGTGGMIYPAHMRGNLASLSDVDKAAARIPEGLTVPERRLALTTELEKAGFTGRKVEDEVVMFDPSNIRSPNAAFDPAKINDPNLMSANPVTGALVPFLDIREKKAAEDPAIANLREYLRKLYAAPAGVNANDPNLT